MASRIRSTVKTCQPKGEYPATPSSIRVNVKMYILSRIVLCTHRNALCKYRNGMFSHRNAFLTILNVLDLFGS